MNRRDKIIQSTDVDALASRYSAVSQGYIQDELVNLFVDSIRGQRGVKERFTVRLPFLNRGTYVRWYAVDQLVDTFVQNGGQQIISLGAGSDTRPFHLLPKFPQLVVHELDFAPSTERKVRIINQHPQLKNVISQEELQGEEIHTPNYHLHAVDLRTITKDSELLPGMDPTLDTLVLSECCLCYLEPQPSDQVLQWALTNFAQCGLVLYEPISRNDQFGVVMKENLASRGISLPTLNKYPSLDTQAQRFALTGFSTAYATDCLHIHENWLSQDDRVRVDKLEFLDEREEFDLMLQHYCIAWATTAPNSPWGVAWSKFNYLSTSSISQ